MNRSFGLIVLGALAAVLGVLHSIDVLLYLGILASALTGGNAFYGISIVGAILAAIVAWIWFWAAGGLWQRDAQAWRFIVFVAIFSLVFDAVAIVGGTPLTVRMPSILLAGLALVLALLPSTREAITPHAAA